MNQIQGTPPIPAASSAPVAKGKESPGVSFRKTYEQAQQNTAAPGQEQTQAPDTASSAKKQEKVVPNPSDTPDRIAAEAAILLSMSGMLQPVDAPAPEEGMPVADVTTPANFQSAALAGIPQIREAQASGAAVAAKPEAEAPPVQSQVAAAVAATEAPQAQSKEPPAFGDRLAQEQTQAIIQEVRLEKQAEPVPTFAKEHAVTLQELSAKNRTAVPADDRFDSMVQQAQEKLVRHATPKAGSQIVAEPAKQDAKALATAEEEPEVQLAGAVMRETPVATTAQTFEAKTKEIPIFEQVSKELVKNLQQGTTSFQMRLQPHELGEVTVRMHLREGKLSVQIAAATPAARSLLEHQMEHLAASLKNTVEVEQVQVTPPQSSPHSGNTPFQMNSGSHPQQQQQAFSGKTQGYAAETIQPEIQQASSEAKSLLDRAV